MNTTAGEKSLVRSRGSSFTCKIPIRKAFSDTEKSYAAIFVLQKTHLNDNECGKWIIPGWRGAGGFFFICLLFVFVFGLGKKKDECSIT